PSRPATSKIFDAGTSAYGAAIRAMKKAGRNSAKVATSNSTTSHQRQRTRNQAILAAANTSDATADANATSISSNQPLTSISSSAGLKMNTNGSTTVRSA